MVGLRVALLVLAAAVLAGCETTPDRYAVAYDACDRQVGACYDACRAQDDERDRRACQARCSAEAERCFARVGEAARQSSLASARSRSAFAFYGRPFYGRHGYWSPYGGWHPGWHGQRYSYAPYGYGVYGFDDPRDCRGRRVSPYCFGHGRGERGPDVAESLRGVVLGAQGDAPEAEAGAAVPPGRRGVVSSDGRRLRYGGKPDPRRKADPNPASSLSRALGGKASKPVRTERPQRQSRPVSRSRSSIAKAIEDQVKRQEP